MGWQFNIRPNYKLLNKYGYITLTSKELDDLDLREEPLLYETEFKPENVSREDFLGAFIPLITEFDLIEYIDTIFYIILYEYDRYNTILFHAYKTYESKKSSKELAAFLLCLSETPESKLSALKLTTLTSTVKITDKKLVSWIGRLVKQGLENGNFSWGELGEGVYELMPSDEKGISFDAPLDYDKLTVIAGKSVKNPNTLVKRHLALFLNNIWYFLENETNLTTLGESKYTDRQLNFLFKLGELLGCLNENGIESEPKDYIRTLFENYIKL